MHLVFREYTVQPEFIKTKIWIYHLLQRPSHNSRTDIDFLLIEPLHLELDSISPKHSSYTLRILEPQVLGFDYTTGDEIIRNVVLSFNLVLNESIFSTRQINFSEINSTILAEELSLISKLDREKASKINFGQSYLKRRRTKTHYEFEGIHENDVLATVIMLNKLHRMRRSSKIQIADLKKALEAFSLAMTSIEKLSCFYHLYSALELALKCDRNEANFDSRVSELTKIDENKVTQWRDFNNRLKHVNRNARHQIRYTEGKKNLDDFLNDIRLAASKVIFYRLTETLNFKWSRPKVSMLKLSTSQLIRKFGPMMNEEELDAYENKNGMPAFDVVFYHPSGTKTLWGRPKQYFQNTILRHLANNIYDLLFDGYEVWIRDIAISSETKISPEHVGYAMSLEADNMSEDGMALTFRMVAGWLVISRDLDSDDHGPIAQKFYNHFGIHVDLSHAPDIGDTPESEEAFERFIEKEEKKVKAKWERMKQKMRGAVQGL